MGDERLATAGRKREEKSRGQAGEDAGEDGGKDYPGQSVQAAEMLARRFFRT